MGMLAYVPAKHLRCCLRSASSTAALADTDQHCSTNTPALPVHLPVTCPPPVSPLSTWCPHCSKGLLLCLSRRLLASGGRLHLQAICEGGSTGGTGRQVRTSKAGGRGWQHGARGGRETSTSRPQVVCGRRRHLHARPALLTSPLAARCSPSSSAPSAAWASSAAGASSTATCSSASITTGASSAASSPAGASSAATSAACSSWISSPARPSTSSSAAGQGAGQRRGWSGRQAGRQQENEPAVWQGLVGQADSRGADGRRWLAAAAGPSSKVQRCWCLSVQPAG